MLHCILYSKYTRTDCKMGTMLLFFWLFSWLADGISFSWLGDIAIFSLSTYTVSDSSCRYIVQLDLATTSTVTAYVFVLMLSWVKVGTLKTLKECVEGKWEEQQKTWTGAIDKLEGLQYLEVLELLYEEWNKAIVCTVLLCTVDIISHRSKRVSLPTIEEHEPKLSWWLIQ